MGSGLGTCPGARGAVRAGEFGGGVGCPRARGYPLQERYELGRSTLIQGGDQELARTLTDVLIDSPPPICTSQGAFTFPESSAGL